MFWSTFCGTFNLYWGHSLWYAWDALLYPISYNNCRDVTIIGVSNGSGPSLRVRVRVGTELVPDWRSGLWINPNSWLEYGSINISLPVWIVRVLSGLYSGSISKYIYHACLCDLIIVVNQNPLFDIQKSHFACFACCDIDNILIHVFLLMICIFDHGGGQ